MEVADLSKRRGEGGKCEIVVGEVRFTGTIIKEGLFLVQPTDRELIL